MTHLVVDNFLPLSLQNQLEGALMNDIPWQYRDSSSGEGDHADPNDTNIKESTQFVHNIFHDKEGIQSHIWELAKIPLMFLEHYLNNSIKMPQRVKANLLLQDPLAVEKYHAPHVDLANEDAFSMVYYVHDCDGDTIIFDKTVNKGHTNLKEIARVTPKKGQAVIFNSNRFHTSSSPVINKRRVIINYAFFAGKTFLSKTG
jgi:hypothetical protein|tara:strand:- start:852 stop:1454 length:603 start_codon:yes stop_codon:yes gene_type:complete